LKTVRLELKSLRVADDISNDLKLCVGVESRVAGNDGKSRDTVSSRNSLETVSIQYLHCLGLGLEGYCLGFGLECSILVSCLVETVIKAVMI